MALLKVPARRAHPRLGLARRQAQRHVHEPPHARGGCVHDTVPPLDPKNKEGGGVCSNCITQQAHVVLFCDPPPPPHVMLFRFHPRQEHVFATGSYDEHVRLSPCRSAPSHPSMRTREHAALGLAAFAAGPASAFSHANLAAAAPHNPGLLTVILPASPGMRSIHPHKWQD